MEINHIFCSCIEANHTSVLVCEGVVRLLLKENGTYVCLCLLGVSYFFSHIEICNYSVSPWKWVLFHVSLFQIPRIRFYHNC